MAKKGKDFQVNIRIDEEDLAFIKAKAERLGWNVSQFVKAAALNAEFTIQMLKSVVDGIPYDEAHNKYDPIAPKWRNIIS